MKDDWKLLKELIINPKINIIHVDTRDFHFVTNSMKVNGSKESLIKENEITPFLNDLLERSGGKSKWRLLSFDDYKDIGGNWCKYLRFYRIDGENWSLCNQYAIPFVNWKEITKHIKSY